jgi:hypothetical protein
MSGIADKHKNIALVSGSAGLATAKFCDAMSLVMVQPTFLVH